MGKYMRKAKAVGEVAVMELGQASLGVRTRARTLALQRHQRPQVQPVPDGSYLQLRSRRLEKPPPAAEARRNRANSRGQVKRAPRGDKFGGGGGCCGGGKKDDEEQDDEKEEDDEEEEEEEEEEEKGDGGAGGNRANGEGGDTGVEASFGENVLEFEARERGTRESTPCSLIRNPDSIRTPGSTTRRKGSSETKRRVQNSSQRQIPTSCEMDEFFAGAEKEQQKKFMEKYNFDPINDMPLPGRYQWEKLDP